MRSSRILTLLLAVLLSAAALTITPRSARAAGAPCFDQVAPLPGVIPPWGFHTGDPLTASRGSYARAYGDIDLGTDRITGKICQVSYVHAQEELIVLQPLPRIIFHTHTALMWGFPGNKIITRVRVTTSGDASCRAGSVGTMTMYASYNGVRSDSIRFHFGKSCASHDHLYHGPQVNAQVPPA